MVDNNEIGARIAARRHYLRWSQEYLSDRLGVGTSTVGRWETGTRAVSLDNLQQLAKALNTTTDYFLSERITRETTARQEIAAATYDSEMTDAEAADIADYIRFKRWQRRADPRAKDEEFPVDFKPHEWEAGRQKVPAPTSAD